MQTLQPSPATDNTASQPQLLLPAPPPDARRRTLAKLHGRVKEIEAMMGASAVRWLHPDYDAVRIERDELCREIETLEALGDGGPLLTLTLDAYASTVARRALAEGDVSEAADVVNGAVVFTLGSYDDHDWPEEAEKAAARRVAACNDAGQASSDNGPAGHAVTIYLTPTQMRMFMQIAEDDGTGSMADVVLRELGMHVALHLECDHNHDLDAVLQRWAKEGKEAA